MSYLCDECRYSDCKTEPCSDFVPEGGAGADANRCQSCSHGAGCHTTSPVGGDSAGAKSAASTRDRAVYTARAQVDAAATACAYHDADGTPCHTRCTVCHRDDPGTRCCHAPELAECAHCHAPLQPQPHVEFWYQGGVVSCFEATGSFGTTEVLELLGDARGIVLRPDGRAWRLEQDESWSQVDAPRLDLACTAGPLNAPLHHVWCMPRRDIPSWGVRLRALRDPPPGFHHVAAIEWPAFAQSRAGKFRRVPMGPVPSTPHPLPPGTHITTLHGECDDNGSCEPGARGLVVSHLGYLGPRQGHAYRVQFPLAISSGEASDPDAEFVSVVIDQGDRLDDPDDYRIELAPGDGRDHRGPPCCDPAAGVVQHPLPGGTLVQSVRGEEDGDGSCGAGTMGRIIQHAGDQGPGRGHAYVVRFPQHRQAEFPVYGGTEHIEVLIDEVGGLDDPDLYTVHCGCPYAQAWRAADEQYRTYIDEGLPHLPDAYGRDHGDRLADFIAIELWETMAGHDEPLRAAHRSMAAVAASLDSVAFALEELLEEEESAEPQAPEGGGD